MKVVSISMSYSPSPILLVMHEMIKKKGHESYYIHFPVFSPRQYTAEGSDEVKKVTDELMKICEDADLISFTCMTNTFIPCAKFIQEIKKRKDVPIAMGGIHPTAKPMECLQYADYVCIGEGEPAFMELIDRLAAGKDTSDIPSFYVKKKNGEIVKNPQGQLIKDLDSLPVPSFNLKECFFVKDSKLICMDDYKDDQEMLMQYFTRYYITVTSRGCPYKCKFCINDVLKRLDKQYYGIRHRSVDHIMQELRGMKKIIKYPITIGFADDDFFARQPSAMKEFAEVYKKEIGIPFFCSSTPHSMKEDKMKYAVEAGIHRLEIGIQSINDKTNWEIHGRAGLKKDVVRAMNIASVYGNKIQINYDIMLDNPWEEEESILETLQFMFEIPKPCTFAIFSLNPFPGTSLYEKAKKEGMLKDQEKLIYNNDIMTLKNDALNTLITLYGKYKVPAPLIKVGIKLRKVPPFNMMLKYSTIPLWRFYAYYEGLKTSIGDMNVANIKYYLAAPFLKLVSPLKRTKKKESVTFSTESLEKSSEIQALKDKGNKKKEISSALPVIQSDTPK